MANTFFELLSNWYPKRDQCEWVLITVINVRGSNYRRPGAMMLISEYGEALGLISGGCLEKSLLTSVKKVLSTQQPLRLEIDSSNEGNLPSLGCGGQVSLWLQPVSLRNGYQSLDKLYSNLCERAPVLYQVCLKQASNNCLLEAQALNMTGGLSEVLNIHPKPQVHIGIFGGGVDAKPMATLAMLMGWRVSVVECRTGFALAEDFQGAEIIRANFDDNQVKSLVKSLDAALVMTHNLALDAQALAVMLPEQLTYLGLLGPTHRREKVFGLAGLDDDPRVFGPMGLYLGGDLPESVALSVIAQIQQVFELGDKRESVQGSLASRVVS